jgi:hypothetical protein
MSSADVNPTTETSVVPVISAPPVTVSPTTADSVAFQDVVQTLGSDAHEALAGAISYLEAAAETTKSQVDVVVTETSQDAEKLAFTVAEKHGFANYLNMFKDSINAGIAKIEVGVSAEVHQLIDKGIAALKGLKLS